MKDYLSKRNEQILKISDLPIEWMLIKNTPLDFLYGRLTKMVSLPYDVCRIQDSNIPGLINNYSAFSKTTLTLGPKTIKNTLIIFSSNENDKQIFQTPINQLRYYKKNLDLILNLHRMQHIFKHF